VEGSSYRRPGARMLICENGQLTGAISGGCLEGDALRKALSAILQNENKLVTYDSMDEDDAKFGVQLGCNGIVYILFEPINTSDPLNPIELLKKLEQKREPAVLATIFSLTDQKQIGTTTLYKANKVESNLDINLLSKVELECAEAFKNKSTLIKSIETIELIANALYDFIKPPVSIIIIGAGNDVQPLVEIVSVLGWQITVADGRPTHATAQRFPKADQLIISKADQLLDQLTVDEQTAFVLMSHNYNYDLAMLATLLKSKITYIGVLGPKKKLIRMFDELQVDQNQDLSHIHGPVGLDIGAETAEEIAISIVSEIKSVFAERSGKTLKDKNAPIHKSAEKFIA
jgi:xanthine dehydrogenase accessory factor